MPRRKHHPRTKASRRTKVAKVMREHKKGTLRSSSGAKVTKRDQAVAIAMSESGQAKENPQKRRK